MPPDGHVGDGTKSLSGETTIHMNVGNVHLGKGLLKDGKPPCSILRFLGGEWSSLGVDRKPVIDVVGILFTAQSHSDLEDTRLGILGAGEDSLDSVRELCYSCSRSEEPTVTKVSLDDTMRLNTLLAPKARVGLKFSGSLEGSEVLVELLDDFAAVTGGVTIDVPVKHRLAFKSLVGELLSRVVILVPVLSGLMGV